MKKATPEVEAEARAFVRRYSAAYGLDPDKVWEDNNQKLLKKELGWFVTQRNQEEILAADYRASRTPGRNSPSKIQWPWVETGPAPDPIYLSFVDYLERTTYAEQMVRCHAAAKKANRERLLSPLPKRRLVGADVWNVIEAARGRCSYCGSLALESRPSKPNGAPAPWAQVGRRIGSLEHRHWRAGGGGNELTNLAWCCLWCNTFESQRRAVALDHGGFHPLPDNLVSINTIIRERRSVRSGRKRAHNQEAVEEDDVEDQELYQWPYISSGEPR